MTFTDDALDRLAPTLPWHADWSDVVWRAGELRAGREVPKRPGKRRLIAAVIVLFAVLAPLVAFAATNDWWFFTSTNAPRPVSAPVVVKEGEWTGHRWQLIAYPSTATGLCFSVTPKDSAQSGFGGALSCAPFAGVPRTAKTSPSQPNMTITYLHGSIVPGVLPAYIAGPVIDKAVEVEIRFAGGQDLRVPTFGAPAPLQHIRFYATELRDGPSPNPRDDLPLLDWVAGLDRDGNVVACLATLTAKDGISPLSDCR